MVGILQWPFGPVDVISLIATWRWKRCHQRDTNTGCVCFTLRQGIPWLHVHLQSACGRVAYSYKSPTNLAGNFLHMTCGTLWICELKLKKWPIFSKKKPRPSTTIMSGTPRVKVTSSAILPRFLDGPLGQCWGGPYWGAMVTDALLMDHIISKLGKGYRFFFSVRETIFTWNDSFDFICMWCVDHDVRKLRFCDSFLMFFFSTDFGPGKQVEDTEPTPEEVAEKKQEERYCRLLRNKTASNVKSDSNMSFFSASWPLKIHSHWHASILHLFFPHSTENIGVLHLTPSDPLMDWPSLVWLEQSQAGWITPLLLLVKVWSSQPWPQGIPGDTWGYLGRYDWLCPFSDKDEAGTTTASAIFLLFCILQFFVKFRPQRIRESS